MMKDEIELINYVYKNAKMGVTSTSALLKDLEKKDNKIKNVVEDILRSYEQWTNESKRMLSSLNEKGEEFNTFTTACANMGVKMNVMKDNSDSAIADLLIKGLTMGEIEATKMLNSCDKDISYEVKKLVRDFKDFQSNAIVKLKKYI